MFEEDSQYVQLRRTQKMNEETKSYPMLERESRNPVVKESFEIRMERRVKNWKQLQHEKKVFGDNCAMDYSGAFESDVKGV